MKRALVPVRVRDCSTDGLLKSIVHIDLVGLDEQAAEERLLTGLKEGRRKPAERPAYPGAAGPSGPPPFPAATPAPTAPNGRPGYMPKIRGAVTDLDRSRFIRDAFAAIQQRFQGSLAELSRHNREVDVDLLAIDATKFTAEIFVAGKSQARCKIWIGGLTGGNEIAYSEGSTSQSSNSMNEALSLTENTGELALRTMLGMFGGQSDDGLDLKNLNADDAAEYLWRRFSSDLER